MMKYIHLLFYLLLCSVSFSQNRVTDTLSAEEVNKLVLSYSKEIQELKSTIRNLDSNAYAYEKIAFCAALNDSASTSIELPWDYYDIKVLSCLGNRDEQSVTLTLIFTQSEVNQKIYIDKFGLQAIDQTGNAHGSTEIQMGVAKSHVGNIYTDVPIKVKFKFESVMPGTELFNLIAFNMSSLPLSSRQTLKKEVVEIRNVLIAW
jgi:hypothetical protein